MADDGDGAGRVERAVAEGERLRSRMAEVTRRTAEVAELSARVHEDAAAVHDGIADPLLRPEQLRDHAAQDRAFAAAERRAADELDG